MKTTLPKNHQEAFSLLRTVLENRDRLDELSTTDFLAGWQSIFFIAPGLHPDEAAHSEGGWPAGWMGIAKEAFRRATAGYLNDDQLYPYEACQAGMKWRRVA